MDNEIKELLEENLRLSKENNAYLRKLVRAENLSRISKILYWVVILALGYVTYTVIQPYLTTVLTAYENVAGQAELIQDKATGIEGNINDLKGLIQGFGE